MLWTAAALIISYLLGSIPTGYLFAKMKGVDIRKVGSGNVGATNAMRVLGKKAGAVVLLVDILKGFLAVIVIGDFMSARLSFTQAQNLRIIIGLCCICGHNWNIFLNFRGGKGIATSFGVLLGLSLRFPGLGLIIGILVLVWLGVFMVWRIVSLASLTASTALPVCAIIFKQPFLMVFVSLLLCLFVFIRHKSNLLRLIYGTEPRLYFGGKDKHPRR
jgi:glycerol-3-phosphate acyltransferase PlsY